MIDQQSRHNLSHPQSRIRTVGREHCSLVCRRIAKGRSRGCEYESGERRSPWITEPLKPTPTSPGPNPTVLAPVEASLRRSKLNMNPKLRLLTNISHILNTYQINVLNSHIHDSATACLALQHVLN